MSGAFQGSAFQRATAFQMTDYVDPSLATVALTALVPDIILNFSIDVPLATMSMTTLAPAYEQQYGVPLGSLTMTLLANTMEIQAGINLGTLVLTDPGSNSMLEYSIALAALTTTLLTPGIETGQLIPLGALALSLFTPTLEMAANPPVATLLLAGSATFILEHNVAAAALVMTLQNLILDDGANIPLEALLLTAYLPDFSYGVNVNLATLLMTIFGFNTDRAIEMPGPQIIISTPEIQLDLPLYSYLRPGIQIQQSVEYQRGSEVEYRKAMPADNSSQGTWEESNSEDAAEVTTSNSWTVQ